MGVRAKSNRHAFLKRELQNLAAGINLLTILAQSGGVQFDCAVVFLRGAKESFVERGAILRRAMAELLRQIGVTDDFDDLLAANRRYSTSAPRNFDGYAHAGVAVVTCMDSRLQPLEMLGLFLRHRITRVEQVVDRRLDDIQRISQLMGDFGKGLSAFKKGVSGDNAAADPNKPATAPATPGDDAKTIGQSTTAAASAAPASSPQAKT